MTRLGNLILILLVMVCGVSLWMAQGRPVPSFLKSSDVEMATPVFLTTDALDEPIHLRILNGTDQSGLAGQFALLLPRLGCVVQGVGNAKPWVGSPTMLINRRLSPGHARELALELGGIPVMREWDGRTAEDAVLVLGEDFEILRNRLEQYRP